MFSNLLSHDIVGPHVDGEDLLTELVIRFKDGLVSTRPRAVDEDIYLLTITHCYCCHGVSYLLHVADIAVINADLDGQFGESFFGCSTGIAGYLEDDDIGARFGKGLSHRTAYTAIGTSDKRRFAVYPEEIQNGGGHIEDAS